MRVIGTAGHVDHGKSTLIQALTGTHPDRLKEEQEREMTIDLGFAWWTLPDGEEVGVVDVPGHRDFIENMLAGVGGIDAALLVVAADEGVMPQTREHLAILDLLQIPAGVIALTKIDAVADKDWLPLVEADVRQLLSETRLADAPIVRVSARSVEGLDDLQQALAAVLAERPARNDLGRPRLPVDRVFTIGGFGTVVTGTLVDGVLNIGDEVVVQPGGHRGRVRGLQNHTRKIEQAFPGARTAVNISGVAVEEIERGDVLCFPNICKPTRRLDVQVRLLADAAKGLHHDDEVKLYIGAAERVARVRLLAVDYLAPGDGGWLQLELTEPVVALRGDRFILRRPSPGETIGGGQVLDPHPQGRHKRFAEEVLDHLQALSADDPVQLLRQALSRAHVIRAGELLAAVQLGREEAQQALAALVESGEVIQLEGTGDEAFLADPAYWARRQDELLQLVADYQAVYDLRGGMPREAARSKLGQAADEFRLLVAGLQTDEHLAHSDGLLHTVDHQVQFSEGQRSAVDALLARFAATPFGPPTAPECVEALGEEVFRAVLASGDLVLLSNDVVFRASDFEQAVEDVKQRIKSLGPVSLADMRDQWGTSRRYVQALLEAMDAKGVTEWDGESRRLKG